MKRISAIVFTFLYLLLTSGFAINVHYCLGEVDSVSLIPLSKECCCGETGMDMGCCGDEQIVFQHSPQDQLVTSENTVIKAPFSGILETASIQLPEFKNNENTVLSVCNSSPYQETPLWLKYSNFTFYG